jgi:hypothetical protein
MKLRTRVKDLKTTKLLLIICILALCSCSSKSGCTDSAANNFSSESKYDDTSCVYHTFNIKPDSFLQLKTKFNENSGLLYSNQRIWTFTDGGGETKIFSIDTSDGGEKENIFLNNSLNTDWEDIAQDDEYIYVGDFGNNNGNRTDLVIYKIKKIADTLIKNNSKASIETISFNYPDQTDFRKAEINNYDCEAMIVKDESIYLFTKCHKDLKTRLYKIPKQSGTYTAELKGLFNTNGLVTGADISIDQKSITLTGYNPYTNDAFLWVLKNFKDNQFFTGNKYKVQLGSRNNVGQIEGVCYINNDSLLLSNENYQSVSPTLYKISISQVK